MHGVQKHLKLGLRQGDPLFSKEPPDIFFDLPRNIRPVPVRYRPAVAACRRLGVEAAETLPQPEKSFFGVKPDDPLQRPQVVQPFRAEAALGGAARVGSVEIQLPLDPGHGSGGADPVAHRLVVLVYPSRTKQMGLDDLPADELGAGHPAGILPPVEQPHQRLLIHGQRLIVPGPGQGKIRGKGLGFQHPAHADGRAAVPGGVKQQLHHLRMDPVVAVHKADPFPFGLSQSMIPGGGLALVLLVDHGNPAVLSGVFLADRRTPVRAAVVHQDDLKIREGLGKDAVHTLPQKSLRLVNRHNDTDLRHRFPSFQKSLTNPPWQQFRRTQNSK